MPPITIASTAPARTPADALAVFVAKDGPWPDGLLDAGSGIDLGAELTAARFDGALGAVARVPTRGAAAAPLLLVVGVGEDPTPERLRRAAGTAARQAPRDATLALVVPGDLVAGAPGATAARAVAEGAGLGAYAYTRYRRKATDQPSLQALRLVPGTGVDGAALTEGLAVGQVVVDAVSVARDLVNTPPADKRPPALAETLRDLVADRDVDTEILDDAALAEGGFGGLIGVGRGSSHAPRLVRMDYCPAGADRHVVLVGKGITFDSGGLSLKSSSAMETMKSDMAGAAAVAATMSALAALDVGVRVTGLAALAENMPSGSATRISDVLTHRGGTTVEVMNTDAEGRLVLADALAYGTELQPDAMIDLATLTGAQIVALGDAIAAIMGTDDALVGQLLAASEVAGEQLWRLPLPPEYRDLLTSEVADLRNVGKRSIAGSLVAGLFLKEFTGTVPWAHLDIAGPAFTEDGDDHYLAKGGTGMGVRTLLEYLRG